MSSRPFAFLDARLIDPETGTETRGGVLVENGGIAAVGPEVAPQNLGEHVATLDCGGDCLAPGLIDLRAAPDGFDASACADLSASAAAGGVTTLVASPDVALDRPEALEVFSRFARDAAKVRLLPAGALSKGGDGVELAEFALLREGGARVFSDGPKNLRNSQLFRSALQYARDLDALVLHAPQDPDLAASGVMGEGELAARLGMSGAPREAETIGLQRDLALVRLTGARYCAAPVSTSLSLDLIARAKQEGLDVVCAATINHLSFNENDIGAYDPKFRFDPPLRAEDERLALVGAVASGLIDMVVSDHRPCAVAAKDRPFARAAVGAVGLETLLAAGLRLVNAELMSLPKLLRALTSRPAEILRLPQGRLAPGAPADLILFDPEDPFVLEGANLQSRQKNTPFDKARLQGVVKATMVAGEFVHRADARLEIS